MAGWGSNQEGCLLLKYEFIFMGGKVHTDKTDFADFVVLFSHEHVSPHNMTSISQKCSDLVPYLIVYTIVL